MLLLLVGEGRGQFEVNNWTLEALACAMNVFWHTAEPLGCASARVGHDVSSRLCWNSRSEAQRAGDYSSFFCCTAGNLCQPLS